MGRTTSNRSLIGAVAFAALIASVVAAPTTANAAKRPAWEPVGSWTHPGQAVAVSDNGAAVYTADYLGERVVRHSPRGAVTGSWTDGAADLDVAPDGSIWVVGDFGARHYSADGSLLTTVGDEPYDDVAAIPAGGVYTIQTAGLTGITRWTSGGVAATSSALVTPAAVATDRAGRAYVAEYAGQEVLVLDAGLQELRSWKLPARPLGIAVDGGNRVFVSYGDRRVEVFSTTGRLLARMTHPQPAELTSIDATAAGRLFALDQRTTPARVRTYVMSSQPRLRSKRVDADRRRKKATVEIVCGGRQSRCSGRVLVKKGKQVLASGRYALAPRATKTVKVKVTKRGRTALKRRKKVAVRVVLQPTAGHPHQTKARLTR